MPLFWGVRGTFFQVTYAALLVGFLEEPSLSPDFAACSSHRALHIPRKRQAIRLVAIEETAFTADALPLKPFGRSQISTPGKPWEAVEVGARMPSRQWLNAWSSIRLSDKEGLGSLRELLTFKAYGQDGPREMVVGSMTGDGETTLLQQASYYGRTQCVDFLLENGCRETLKNEVRHTLKLNARTEMMWHDTRRLCAFLMFFSSVGHQFECFGICQVPRVRHLRSKAPREAPN